MSLNFVLIMAGRILDTGSLIFLKRKYFDSGLLQDCDFRLNSDKIILQKCDSFSRRIHKSRFNSAYWKITYDYHLSKSGYAFFPNLSKAIKFIEDYELSLAKNNQLELF